MKILVDRHCLEIDAKDKVILADSAYNSEANEEVMLKNDLEDFVMLKAYRNNPLSEEDKAFNKKVSRIRVRVEHVFGGMKCMVADLFRLTGLKRAKQNNAFCNLIYIMDRYAYLFR